MPLMASAAMITYSHHLYRFVFYDFEIQISVVKSFPSSLREKSEIIFSGDMFLANQLNYILVFDDVFVLQTS